jgi:hypothetical protein
MGRGGPGSLDLGGATSVDDGTLARTDTLTPGAIGLDAHSGGGAHATPNLGEAVLAFARGKRSHHVGDGECFALADGALHSAHARSASDYGTVTPDADYVWGTSVALSALQPGDIIQFRDYRFERHVETNNADGSGSFHDDSQERPHHTAIVESVGANGAVTVLEQNAPAGSAVLRSQLFFTDSNATSGNTTTRITVSGTFWFYRPQAR